MAQKCMDKGKSIRSGGKQGEWLIDSWERDGMGERDKRVRRRVVGSSVLFN
jgi:hypothetical protein